MSTNTAEVTIHRLTEKHPETMTGNCSVCGLVAIAKSGRGFMCGEKKKTITRAWRTANPGKARANRRQRSAHELFGRDYVKLTAQCVRCGPVTMTPWGRGYACGTRAAELRGRQESAVQRPCRECWILDGDRVYLVDGVCPRCSDPRLTDTGAALRDAEHRAGHLAGVPDGFSVVDVTGDAHDIPEFESAVPGWRTIGSHRPWNEV